MIRRLTGIQFDCMFRFDIELLLQRLPLQNNASFQLINYCNAVEKKTNTGRKPRLSAQNVKRNNFFAFSTLLSIIFRWKSLRLVLSANVETQNASQFPMHC